MEVILLQMGKVASTAIARALRAAGGEALQAHLGAPDRLAEKFRTLMAGELSDAVAERLYADYLQELRVTFLLARRRLRQGGGEPLRVITLSRDPLDWYWSHLVQNQDHYLDLLRKFHRAEGGADGDLDPGATLARIQQRMFRVFAETSSDLDSVAGLPRIVNEAQALDPSGVVGAHAYSFLRPLRWFDEDFLPATGIDVYGTDFDCSRGWGRAQAPGISALVLRYEDLDRHLEAIADFTGLENLALPVANRSADRDLPFDIGDLRERGLQTMPPELVARIHATRYARHFGYPRAERSGIAASGRRLRSMPGRVRRWLARRS